MNRSTPGLPVHHQLPEFTQTRIHRVTDTIQPSHPLSSHSPPAHDPSQYQSLFPMSQLFTWGGQSTGVSASASFFPKKSQSWSPSEWTGWISLQSKGLSRVFSNTTVQKHQFSQLGTKQQQWEQAGHSPLIFSFLFSELGGRVILSAYENTRAPSGPFAWILTCNSPLPMNNSSIWITSACSVGEVCMLICMNKYVYWSAYLNISFLRSFLEVCICSTVMMLSTLSPVSSLSGFELVCTLTHLNFTSLS